MNSNIDRGLIQSENWRTRGACWFALILWLATCAVVHAQGVATATIFGTVSDPSGAAVAGATITVTNVATQEVRRTISGNDGTYVVPELQPGVYTLTVEASGFKTYVQKEIRLQVNENRQSTLHLSIGAVQQQVVVNAETAQVDTRSVTISEVVDSRRVEDLPLNGRNPLDLQSLVAGATQVTTGNNGQAENNVISINGAQPNQENYTLDGVDNEDPFFGTPSVYPNPDALAEFSLQTSNYNAQTGLASGAQMNAITKSGTNKFHGTLFEYVRNQIFDAPGYFAKTLPPYHRNQFGGTIGGPILRNHAFFFFAYQGTRESSTPTVETFTSPDTAERSGNFSEISKQLKDPTTGKPVPGNIFTTQLNKASLAFLNAFVPLPNSAKNIYSYSPATFLNDDQYIGRLDTQITRNNHLFGRILEDTNAQDSQNSSTDLPGFLTNVDYTNWSLAVNDTHTFSPTLLNQFIFGFDDIVRLQLPVLPSQTTWGDLGAGVVRAASGPIGYDTRVQGGYFTAETRWPLNQYRHNFQYSDTLSWTRGKHEIYLGGDLRSMYAHQYQDFQSDGQFIFAAVYTGNQLADFETGHELSFSQESFNAGEPVNLTPDLFVQDNWKATARLTANLGLRWNPWVAYHDQFNEISQFIPGQQSTVYLKAPVGYVFPGDAGISQNTINNSWHDFAPRVGLAYDVFGDGKTSLRAGYGIYYAFVRMQALNSFSLNQPYGIILTVARPTGGMTNPYANTGNPFPYTPPQTAQAKAAYQFQLPLTLTVWDPNFQDARIDQWNVNIQQQVRNWIFTIAYVGSAGEHLEFQFERDPAVYGAPGVTEQDRRIFAPNFGSITDQFSGGHSSYDALQLTANRRFSRGFTLLANYTWGKSIDNGSSFGSAPFDPFNIASNRGLSDFDMKQYFVTSFIWDLPKLSTHEFLAKNFVNGWELNSIVTFHDGTPFSVVSGVDNSESGVGADNADRVPGVSRQLSHSSKAAEIAEYFNINAFTLNQVGTFGDSGRNNLYGPGTENIDMAVVKTLYSRGDLGKVLFRGEAFNLFNHTNLGGPTANVSSSTFGEITSAGAPRVLQLALRLEF